MTVKKSKNNFIQKLQKEHFLYFAAGAFILIVCLVLFAVAYQSRVSRQGYTSSGNGLANEYRSLRIEDARNIAYTGSPLKLVRDLGPVNKVQRKIVKFNVEKEKLVEDAFLTLPTTPPPKKGYPVIILCHGYTNPLYYRTDKAYLPDMEFYSRQGFAVIKPDFRGQGLSLSAGAPEGAYYSMAYNNDLMSLIADINQTDYLNKGAINMWGHSMGGYLVLRAAVVSRDIKTAIIISGPVGYAQDMFSSYLPISDTNNPTATAIRTTQIIQHGTPVDNPVFWNQTSPLSYLNDTKTYFQIHVGTDDTVVPWHFSADLDEALNKAGKKHGYFVYDGAGHGMVPQRQQIYERSLQVLKRS